MRWCARPLSPSTHASCGCGWGGKRMLGNQLTGRCCELPMFRAPCLGASSIFAAFRGLAEQLGPPSRYSWICRGDTAGLASRYWLTLLGPPSGCSLGPPNGCSLAVQQMLMILAQALRCPQLSAMSTTTNPSCAEHALHAQNIFCACKHPSGPCNLLDR